MILIGIEDCPTCKIAKRLLPDIPSITLIKGQKSESRILEIKKALGKLNKDNKFPVILNDDLDKIVDTKFILDNLNSKKIENELQNQ